MLLTKISATPCLSLISAFSPIAVFLNGTGIYNSQLRTDAIDSERKGNYPGFVQSNMEAVPHRPLQIPAQAYIAPFIQGWTGDGKLGSMNFYLLTHLSSSPCISNFISYTNLIKLSAQAPSATMPPTKSLLYTQHAHQSNRKWVIILKVGFQDLPSMYFIHILMNGWTLYRNP